MEPVHAGAPNKVSQPGTREKPASAVDQVPETGLVKPLTSSTEYGLARRIFAFLPVIWLTGIWLLGLNILGGHIRILRMIRLGCPLVDPAILDVMADCQALTGMGNPVRMVVTDRIASPALFGLFRPCLLLPARTLTEMNQRELRHIFLHELVHLKHRDILVNLVASAVQILHWFNPLVVYGFKRMRVDRELTCDDSVLSLLHPEETAAYGDTIIRQIELFCTSRSHSVLAQFVEDRDLARQRITMISRFRKEVNPWSLSGKTLVCVLVCIALTDGFVADPGGGTPDRHQETPVKAGMPNDSAESPELTHGFSQTKRIYIRHHQQDKYLIADSLTVSSAAEPGDAGLWEARYDGEFTPDGEMLIYSVSKGKYLSTDDQGNLTADQLVPCPQACWFRQAGPLGVQVISQAFKHGYLRLEEQGQASVVQMGRDLPSQWDIMQLD
jgi:beta-lactamase regulating signal transducer with metallopeptidase domain